MGFHVHVDVTNVSRKDLICICQNFLKYEEVMDAFMPPSRRNNEYCKSNKNALVEAQTSSVMKRWLGAVR